jgi:hypothetical protein
MIMTTLTFLPLYQFPPYESLMKCLNENRELQFDNDPQKDQMVKKIKILVAGYFANTFQTKEQIEGEINSFFAEFVAPYHNYSYEIVDKICAALFICGSASGKLHFIAS